METENTLSFLNDPGIGLHEGMPLEFEAYPAGFVSGNMFRIIPPRWPYMMIVSGVVREPDPLFTKATEIHHWMFVHPPLPQYNYRFSSPEYMRPILIMNTKFNVMPTQTYRDEITWFMVPPEDVLDTMPPQEKTLLEFYLIRGEMIYTLTKIDRIAFDANHPYWQKKK